jgi:hypothetical protein
MQTHRYYASEPTPRGIAENGLPDPDSLCPLPFPRGDRERKAVEKEIRKLLRRYGTIIFGARYAAPCSAWRSERLLLEGQRLYLPRFAYRIHVFQQGVHTNPYGRYIGFLSIRPLVKRPESGFPKYTAVAYLALPPHMLRPRYHVITCEGGPSDGVRGFRCAPYCFVNMDAKSPAACLHVAIHEALLLKANTFGYHVVGSQETVALLWKNQQWGDPAALKATPAEIANRGATLEDALAVLNDDAVHAGGVLETIGPLLWASLVDDDYEGSMHPAVIYEAWRCIGEYLANGLPLIILVGGPHKAIGRQEVAQAEEHAHFVLVLGMHIMNEPEQEKYLVAFDSQQSAPLDRDELPGRLVIHDTMNGPFHEMRATDVIEAGYVARTKDAVGNGISFLALGPSGMRLGIHEVRMAAQRLIGVCDNDFWQRYTAQFGMPGVRVTREDTPRLRYVTRLLHTDQVLRRYCHTRGSGKRKHPIEHKAAAAAVRMVAEMQNAPDWWWAMEVSLPWRAHLTRSSHDTTPNISRETVRPSAVFLWGIGDAPTAHNETPLPRVWIYYESPDVMRLMTEELDNPVRFNMAYQGG